MKTKIFYKYKCRNCGKKYHSLPIICRVCGTELSFICPMDRWSVYPEYKQTTNCEEIFEIAFPFGKKSRIKELERKIRQLNRELSELRNDKIDFETEMDAKSAIIFSLQMENAELKHSNVQYKALIKQYQSGGIRANLNVSQDMVDAVWYAMKKSHPDNGGNAEDFVRFRKCYEELTGRS